MAVDTRPIRHEDPALEGTPVPADRVLNWIASGRFQKAPDRALILRFYDLGLIDVREDQNGRWHVSLRPEGREYLEQMRVARRIRRPLKRMFADLALALHRIQS